MYYDTPPLTPPPISPTSLTPPTTGFSLLSIKVVLLLCYAPDPARLRAQYAPVGTKTRTIAAPPVAEEESAQKYAKVPQVAAGRVRPKPAARIIRHTYLYLTIV